jgi:tetratricopeptide (TPR) repeat protein
MLAALAMPLLLTTKVSAQGSTDWSRCIGGEGPMVDVVTEACTAEIQAGQDGPQKLATAFNNRGVAYRLKGEYDRALQDYEQAIRLNPGNANAYNNRGIVYRIKGEFGRAIADYDEAIWLKNGDFPAAYYNRALAYADKGEYEQSLRDFDVVLRFNPRNALALYARGLTLLKKGDSEAGRDEISAAKAIDPDVADQFDHSETPLR